MAAATGGFRGFGELRPVSISGSSVTGDAEGLREPETPAIKSRGVPLCLGVVSVSVLNLERVGLAPPVLRKDMAWRCATRSPAL